MNYKHIYHAGNFADILKHVTLIKILEEISKDNNSFSVLDGFAGSGLYLLDDERAKKTEEYKQGFSRLVSYPNNSDYAVCKLISLAKDLDANLNKYPGSPFVISSFLSQNSEAIFLELEKGEFRNLKNNFSDYKNTKICNEDFYKFIPKYLGALKSRGLIFIDPPFEKEDEFKKSCDSIKSIYSSKNKNNITAIFWYPIKNYMVIREFYKEIFQINTRKIKIEFSNQGASKNSYSNGILIFNSASEINDLKNELSIIADIFASTKPNFSIDLFK